MGDRRHVTARALIGVATSQLLLAAAALWAAARVEKGDYLAFFVLPVAAAISAALSVCAGVVLRVAYQSEPFTDRRTLRRRQSVLAGLVVLPTIGCLFALRYSGGHPMWDLAWLAFLALVPGAALVLVTVTAQPRSPHGPG